MADGADVTAYGQGRDHLPDRDVERERCVLDDRVLVGEPEFLDHRDEVVPIPPRCTIAPLGCPVDLRCRSRRRDHPSAADTGRGLRTGLFGLVDEDDLRCRSRGATRDLVGERDQAVAVRSSGHRRSPRVRRPARREPEGPEVRIRLGIQSAEEGHDRVDATLGEQGDTGLRSRSSRVQPPRNRIYPGHQCLIRDGRVVIGDRCRLGVPARCDADPLDDVLEDRRISRVVPSGEELAAFGGIEDREMPRGRSGVATAASRNRTNRATSDSTVLRSNRSSANSTVPSIPPDSRPRRTVRPYRRTGPTSPIRHRYPGPVPATPGSPRWVGSCSAVPA